MGNGTVYDFPKRGLIRETLSSCVVLTVITPKKDGGMCTNSSAINNIRTRYRFLLPLMNDIMYYLSGSCYFQSDSHQIQIKNGERYRLPLPRKDNIMDYLNGFLLFFKD
jgi:hypothetical protein